jgi:hypothetical protein
MYVLTLNFEITHIAHFSFFYEKVVIFFMIGPTDYGCPVRKWPSLQSQKSNPNPKFIGMAEAYFVCHIGIEFQISFIYAFIGCL